MSSCESFTTTVSILATTGPTEPTLAHGGPVHSTSNWSSAIAITQSRSLTL